MQVELVGWIDSSVARELGGYRWVRCSSTCTSASYWSNGSVFSVNFSLTVKMLQHSGEVNMNSPEHSDQQWVGHPRSGHLSCCEYHSLLVQSQSHPPAPLVSVRNTKTKLGIESKSERKTGKEKNSQLKRAFFPLWIHPSLWRSNMRLCVVMFSTQCRIGNLSSNCGRDVTY